MTPRGPTCAAHAATYCGALELRAAVPGGPTRLYPEIFAPAAVADGPGWPHAHTRRSLHDIAQRWWIRRIDSLFHRHFVPNFGERLEQNAISENSRYTGDSPDSRPGFAPRIE